MEFKTDKFRDEWRQALTAQNVPYQYEVASAVWQSLLINILPLVLIFGVFWFLMFRQMQGSSNKAMSFGKSRARMVNQGDKKVTFNDVAGVEEAKEELVEIIEFLKDPKRFSRLGGKIPRGVLLVGSRVREKPCLPVLFQGKRKCPSSASAVRTLWRCLSA